MNDLTADDLRLLLECLQEPAVLMGPGGVEMVNQAWATLCGLPAEQILDASGAELLLPLPPSGLPGLRTAFAARLNLAGRPGPLVRGWVLGLQPDKSIWLLQGQASLLDLGALTAGLIHNLAGPLSIIRNSVELLDRVLARDVLQSPELAQVVAGWPPSVRQGFSSVISNVDQLSDAVRDLLAKLRGEAASNAGPQDLNQIIQREMHFIEDNLGLKHAVEKQLSLDPDLPPVTGLYSDFSQSIRNIMNNALKAMQDSPVRQLRVSTERQGDQVVVSIADTGPGIAPQDQSRIFEPFYTGSDAAPESTGLGLYSVRQLLAGYSAEIEVQSRPGKTVFTIRLPFHAQPKFA